MFKIVSKTETNEYNVLDTRDNVVEAVSADELFNSVISGVCIEGVSVSGNEVVIDCDGTSWHGIYKGYKFRLYPNKEQEEYFQKCFGCCRFIWNQMLADRIEHYEAFGETIKPTPASYKAMYPFLSEVDSSPLNYEYRYLEGAFKNFFQKTGVGYPKFKKKKSSRKSYTTENNRGSVRIEDNHIRLPKIGFIKLRLNQPVLGLIKNATVSQAPSGKYFISLMVLTWQKRLPTTDKEVGIDLGLKDIVITSDKERFENPKTLYKYERQLARLQRQLTHKQKGSHNYEKQRKRIAVLYEKITNIRKDNLHKISHRLVQENQLIVTETLRISSMIKSHHFAKSIADVSWYELTRQISYKADWYGRQYIGIESNYPSSQLCSCCGYKNPITKDLSVRYWICPKCGTHHDRDENAAQNILHRGKELLAVV